MLDPRLLRSEPDRVRVNLARRGFSLDTAAYLALEDTRREVQLRVEQLRNERNVKSRGIGKAKAQGQDIAPLLQEVEHLGAGLAAAEADLDAVQGQLQSLQLHMPNLLHESVPDGRDETANQEVRRWGTPREFDFKPMDHVDVGTRLGLLDLEAEYGRRWAANCGTATTCWPGTTGFRGRPPATVCLPGPWFSFWERNRNRFCSRAFSSRNA